MWTAAILAGGQGRRLGGIDKSGLVVGAHSILDRQLSLLRELTPHILIVGADAAGGFNAASSVGTNAGANVVEDRITGAGALGGIYTALTVAPTEQVLVMACDMPFVTAPFLRALAARGQGLDAAMPRDARGRHPLCASYDRRIAAHLKHRIDSGQLRVLDAVAGLDVHELGPDELALFDTDGRLLMNINTPDDYQRARTTT